jgi:hypothetical protein
MTKEEIMAEIGRLDAEAKQMLANANFLAGAASVYHKLLAQLENKND